MNKANTNAEMLIEAALKAREFSYCPYSGYAVGAAVLGADDIIYTGCNIENASYGATNCAERTAVFKAISEGNLKIKAVAVCGGDKGKAPIGYAYPCGICRQVISEFATDLEMPVYVAISLQEFQTFTIKDLLPASFGESNLNEH